MTTPPIKVTEGQLSYELMHLSAKLRVRDKKAYESIEGLTIPDAHPLFAATPGPIAEWERPNPQLVGLDS